MSSHMHKYAWALMPGKHVTLSCILGGLYWRSIGGVGYRRLHIQENDTGPDEANHAEQGMFIMREPNGAQNKELHGLKLFDVSATILDRFGFKVPDDMQGKVIPAG